MSEPVKGREKCASAPCGASAWPQNSHLSLGLNLQVINKWQRTKNSSSVFRRTTTIASCWMEESPYNLILMAPIGISLLVSHAPVVVGVGRTKSSLAEAPALIAMAQSQRSQARGPLFCLGSSLVLDVDRFYPLPPSTRRRLTSPRATPGPLRQRRRRRRLWRQLGLGRKQTHLAGAFFIVVTVVSS